MYSCKGFFFFWGWGGTYRPAQEEQEETQKPRAQKSRERKGLLADVPAEVKVEVATEEVAEGPTEMTVRDAGIQPSASMVLGFASEAGGSVETNTGAELAQLTQFDEASVKARHAEVSNGVICGSALADRLSNIIHSFFSLFFFFLVILSPFIVARRVINVKVILV